MSSTVPTGPLQEGAVAPPVRRSNPLSKIYVQVLIGAALGVLIGHFFPGTGRALQPLAEGFIRLIKVMIGPIVFCFVVTGIIGAGDLRRAGRVAIKTIVYFEVVTTIALLIGLVLALVLRPGEGMNIDPAKLDPSIISAYTEQGRRVTNATEFLLGLIPNTFFGAFARGDILQILLLAVLCGVALQLMSPRARQPILDFVESGLQMLFRIMGFIIRLSPLGVMGAIAFTVGTFGVGSLQKLGLLIVVYYLGCAILVAGVLGGAMGLSRGGLGELIRYLRDEIFIALGSSSSDAVLPVVMAKLRHLGVKDTTVGLVVPLGYSFNLDGFSLWLTVAVVFIAQATNTPLSAGDLALLLGVALLTSKGAHGIPGSAIVVLAATLSAIPLLPVIGIAIILSVDKVLGFVRVAVNLIGNCVAPIVIAAWEGELDHERARQVLNGEVEFYFGSEEEPGPA